MNTMREKRIFTSEVWSRCLLALDTALSDNDLYPVLLGTAFPAYSFRLRHAVDADHIAAIDNLVLGFTF